MGFVQVVRCEGCGSQGAARAGIGTIVTAPEGWQVRNVSSPGIFGAVTARVITVCPECWGTKTLAEVLGS